ncbi:MAG TPA: ABC transporter permease [Acidimicrobiia bacterium]
MSIQIPPRAETSNTDRVEPGRAGRTRSSRIWRRARRSNRIPWLPISIVVLILILPALFADLLTVHDPLRGTLGDRLIPPGWMEGGSWTYPLGTDKQGRDIMTRIIYGARISLTVSSLTILIGAVVGSTLGLLAGYFGGWIDRMVSWLIDTFLSLPHVLLALVIVAAIGPSFVTIVVIIAVTIWASFARQVRGETLSVRETEYVARARVAGARSWRILMRHILPNVANTLIVLATLQVGVVILEESSLSFIGAGIPRPNPSWGVMVADGRDQILTSWWISFFPGLAILLVVLSLNLMGDWLRDFLDPKMRQRQ